MFNAAENLTSRGAPNNILTRNMYRVGFVISYTVVTITAFIKRKDRTELANSWTAKLKNRKTQTQ